MIVMKNYSRTGSILALISFWLVIYVCGSSQSIETTYSTARYHFSADRVSLFPENCIQFSWDATYAQSLTFNNAEVLNASETTLCSNQDITATLTVLYQDGNPFSRTIRVPGTLGFFNSSMLVALLVLATGQTTWKHRIAGSASLVLKTLNTAFGALKSQLIDWTAWLPPRFRKEHAGISSIDYLYRVSLLVALMAIIQLAYVLLGLGSWSHWGSYWLYVAFGVIVPGSLLLLATTNWQADWLTWLGLGWTVGHGMELVLIQVAKAQEAPQVFLIWIPVAYMLGFVRRSHLKNRFRPMQQTARVLVALCLLFVIGFLCYFALNLPELSQSPPYVSDVWFHINNAHEFRDHAVIQDPRIAGEPFNYHMFGYAPAAAASLVTDIPVVNLLTSFGGSGAVFLFALLLFNMGRMLSSGSILAGLVGALLVIFPLDVLALLSPTLNVGSFLMFYGVYVSTTTLAGYIYLSALLISVLWFLRKPDWFGTGIILLFAYAGAGSKSMFGPLIVCGAVGLVGWHVLSNRMRLRFSLPLLGLVLLPAAWLTINLVFGENSYSESIRWIYADFASNTAFFETFLSLGWPPFLLRTIWVVLFGFLFILGAIVSTSIAWRSKSARDFLVFVWLLYLASMVAAMFTSLKGASQLFFIYYGLATLAPLAGHGLVRIAHRLLARKRRSIAIALAILMINGSLILFPASSRLSPAWLVEAGAGVWWRAYNWAPDIFSGLEKVDNLLVGDLGPYAKKLDLTDELADGLAWGRENLSTEAVFVVNVRDAAAYAGYSERRAFFETSLFSVAHHNASDSLAPDETFSDRMSLVDAWMNGDVDSIERMRLVGVTHIFVDLVNGDANVALPDWDPIFQNGDLLCYAISPSSD